MKNILLSTVIAVGFASVAIAGTPGPIAAVAPVTIAAPVAGVDWSGFYAGGLVSFDGGDFDYLIFGTSTSVGPLTPTTTYGGFAGYNKQLSNFVIGGEIAYTIGDVFLAGLPASYYGDKIDLKARLGYSVGPALVYGVVGYSFAPFANGVGNDFPSAGLNYGAGVDLMITDKIFVGAEYLVRDFSGDGLTSPFTMTSAFSSTAIRIGVKF